MVTGTRSLACTPEFGRHCCCCGVLRVPLGSGRRRPVHSGRVTRRRARTTAGDTQEGGSHRRVRGMQAGRRGEGFCTRKNPASQTPPRQTNEEARQQPDQPGRQWTSWSLPFSALSLGLVPRLSSGCCHRLASLVAPPACFEFAWSSSSIGHTRAPAFRPGHSLFDAIRLFSRVLSSGPLATPANFELRVEQF